MEDWKDRIIASVEGAARATPRAEAYLKIQRHLGKQASIRSAMRKQYISVAAAISLIVIGNIVFINHYFETSEAASEQALANSYTILSDYNIYQ